MSKNRPSRETGDREELAIDFEVGLKELEAIVRRLEDGTGSLEEALDDYSKAVQLLKQCHNKLECAQRKVELLSGVDAQGNPILEEVSDTETQLEEKQGQRSQRRSAAAPSARSGPARGGRQDDLF